MNVAYVLEFDIRSWWHVGSGLGMTADVDDFVSRDVHGLPIIHGKAVKGLVREALQFAADFKHLPPEAPDWFCGTPLRGVADDGRKLRRQRFSTVPGHAEFGTAELSADWRAFAGDPANRIRIDQLFHPLHATAIDEVGQARDHTLRCLEVAAPMTLMASLHVNGEPEWTRDERWAGLTWKAALKRALPLICGCGGSRTRGLGRVAVRLVETEIADIAMKPAEEGTRVFRIDLLDDVILSLDSATAGQHRSLDFIPGSVLLGVVARHYERFAARGIAWDVFHSGRVRFGNAYPLVEGQPTVPVPLSWQTPKYPDEIEDAAPDGVSLVRDASVEATPAREQWEQLRGGFVSTGFRLAQVEKRYRRMTAIDRERRGHSRTAHLFGYEAIAAGQSFWFELDVDGDPVIADDIARCLTDGEIRLGKSRGAEFGRARVSTFAGNAPSRSGAVTEGAGCVLVHALSDLAFIDRTTGTPSARPTPEDFGLAGWSLDLSRSFIRTRRYSPYNAHRRSFDGERLVVTMGSVLRFERGDGPALDENAMARLRDLERSGVGLHRQEGLGAVAINSWCLGEPTRFLSKASPEHGRSAPVPADALARLMTRRYVDTALTAFVHRIAEDYEKLFLKLYHEVAGEARRSGQRVEDAAPTRAQWGEVRRAAGRAASIDGLRSALFDPNAGICTSGMARPLWIAGSPFDPRPDAPDRFRPTSFTDLLVDVVQSERLSGWLRDVGLTDEDGVSMARALLVALGQRMPRTLMEAGYGREGLR